MRRTQSSNVSVVPNASKVRGVLLQIKPEPDGWGSVWELALNNTCSIPELPNFVNDYVGRIIEVFVPPRPRHNVKERDEIEAKVAFRGDEKSGRFVLVEGEAHKVRR